MNENPFKKWLDGVNMSSFSDDRTREEKFCRHYAAVISKSSLITRTPLRESIDFNFAVAIIVGVGIHQAFGLETSRNNLSLTLTRVANTFQVQFYEPIGVGLPHICNAKHPAAVS